jgi:hypothetical protein
MHIIPPMGLTTKTTPCKKKLGIYTELCTAMSENCHET